MNIKRRQFFKIKIFAVSEEVTIHPYDDVAVDFLFEEDSEPEERADDDSSFSP